MLFYQQELSLRETAQALGVTTGTVKTLLFRSRKRLRAMLQRDDSNREEE
jgi:DNA-directed RNA polymerase specialized sigma24 family protein